MDMKKYWFEAFLVIVAGLFLICYVISQWVWPVVRVYWIALAILGIIIVVVVASPKWIPAIWRGIKAVQEHDLRMKTGHTYLQLLEATVNRTKEGHDIEYHNAQTEDVVKVHNPHIALHIEMVKAGRPAQVNVQLQAQQQQDLLAPVYPEPQDFANVLQYWRPSPESIYMLDTVNGPVTVPLAKTYHIGLAGPTGAGKTNVFRLQLAQALLCGAKVYLANPNFAPVKMNEKSVEDWRPIAAKVEGGMVAWRIEDMMQLLDDGIAELERRRLRQQSDPRPQEDVYYGFGEWPAIVSMVMFLLGKKEADKVVGQLGRLLRESRQYNMHVLSEFQDALVQTIGGNSGLRENYRTIFYSGGDPTTAKALLDLKNGETVDETGLGQMGAFMLRCQSNRLARGRVPFFSNRALYMLLGEPELALPDKVDQLTPELLESITRGLLGSKFDAVTEPIDAVLSRYGNLTVVQGSRAGRQPEEIDPEHIAYARENRLSDRQLAQALQITQYHANKINNIAKEQELSMSERMNG